MTLLSFLFLPPLHYCSMLMTSFCLAQLPLNHLPVFIIAVCSKSRKLLGFIYHSFYHSCSSRTLLKLYLSLMLPHLCYCSSAWDLPASSIYSQKLEKVQHFAIKICSTNWNSDYPVLLSAFDLSTLSLRRQKSKLLLLFKLINNIMYCPPGTFHFPPPPSRFSPHYHPSNLLIPFCETTSSFNSFSVSSGKLLNSLPAEIKTITSFSAFKRVLISDSFCKSY